MRWPAIGGAVDVLAMVMAVLSWLTVSPLPSAAPGGIAVGDCYGGAVAWRGDEWGVRAARTFGPYRTTARCADINMRQTGTAGRVATACVRFGSPSAPCNRWTTVRHGPWFTVATGVADGTTFYVTLANGDGGAPVQGHFAY